MERTSRVQCSVGTNTQACQTEDESAPLDPWLARCVSLLKSSPEFQELTYRLQQSYSGETTLTVTCDRMLGLLGGMQDPLSLFLSSSGLCFFSVLFRPVQVLDLQLHDTGDLNLQLLRDLLGQLNGRAGYGFCPGFQLSDFPEGIRWEDHGLQVLAHPCPRVQAERCPVFWQLGLSGSLEKGPVPSLRLCPICTKAGAEVYRSLKSQGQNQKLPVFSSSSDGPQAYFSSRSAQAQEVEARRADERSAVKQPNEKNAAATITVKAERRVECYTCSYSSPTSSVAGRADSTVKSEELDTKFQTGSKDLSTDKVCVSTDNKKPESKSSNNITICNITAATTVTTSITISTVNSIIPVLSVPAVTSCVSVPTLQSSCTWPAKSSFNTEDELRRPSLSASSTSLGVSACDVTAFAIAVDDAASVTTSTVSDVLSSTTTALRDDMILAAASIEGVTPCKTARDVTPFPVRTDAPLFNESKNMHDVSVSTTPNTHVDRPGFRTPAPSDEDVSGRWTERAPVNTKCPDNSPGHIRSGENVDSLERATASDEPEAKRSCYRCPICAEAFPCHSAVHCHVIKHHPVYEASSTMSLRTTPSSAHGADLALTVRANGHKPFRRKRKLVKHLSDSHFTTPDSCRKRWKKHASKKNMMEYFKKVKLSASPGCQNRCSPFKTKNYSAACLREHSGGHRQQCTARFRAFSQRVRFDVKSSHGTARGRHPHVLGRRRQRVVRGIVNKAKLRLEQKMRTCRAVPSTSTAAEHSLSRPYSSASLEAKPFTPPAHLSAGCLCSAKLSASWRDRLPPQSATEVKEEKPGQKWSGEQHPCCTAWHETKSVNESFINALKLQPASKQTQFINDDHQPRHPLRNDVTRANSCEDSLQVFDRTKMKSTESLASHGALRNCRAAKESPLSIITKACDDFPCVEEGKPPVTMSTSALTPPVKRPSSHEDSSQHSLIKDGNVSAERLKTNCTSSQGGVKAIAGKDFSSQVKEATLTENCVPCPDKKATLDFCGMQVSHISTVPQASRHTDQFHISTVPQASRHTDQFHISTVPQASRHTDQFHISTVPQASRHTDQFHISTVPQASRHTDQFHISTVPQASRNTDQFLAVTHSDTNDCRHSHVSVVKQTDTSEVRPSEADDVRCNDTNNVRCSDVREADCNEVRHSDVSDVKHSETREIRSNDVRRDDVSNVKDSDATDVMNDDSKEGRLAARERSLQLKEEELQQRQLALSRQSQVIQQLMTGWQFSLRDSVHGSGALSPQEDSTLTPQQALAICTALSKAARRKQNNRTPVFRRIAPKPSSTERSVSGPSTSARAVHELQSQEQTEHTETGARPGGEKLSTETVVKASHSVPVRTSKEPVSTSSTGKQTHKPALLRSALTSGTVSFIDSASSVPLSIPSCSASTSPHPRRTPGLSTHKRQCSSSSLRAEQQGESFLQEMMTLASRMPASAKEFLPRRDTKQSSTMPRVDATVKDSRDVPSQPPTRSSHGWSGKKAWYFSGGRMKENLCSLPAEVPAQEIQRLLTLTCDKQPLSVPKKESRSTHPRLSALASSQSSGAPGKSSSSSRDTETCVSLASTSGCCPRAVVGKALSTSQRTPVSDLDFRAMPPLILASRSDTSFIPVSSADCDTSLMPAFGSDHDAALIPVSVSDCDTSLIPVSVLECDTSPLPVSVSDCSTPYSPVSVVDCDTSLIPGPVTDCRTSRHCPAQPNSDHTEQLTPLDLTTSFSSKTPDCEQVHSDREPGGVEVRRPSYDKHSIGSQNRLTELFSDNLANQRSAALPGVSHRPVEWRPLALGSVQQGGNHELELMNTINTGGRLPFTATAGTSSQEARAISLSADSHGVTSLRHKPLRSFGHSGLVCPSPEPDSHRMLRHRDRMTRYSLPSPHGGVLWHEQPTADSHGVPFCDERGVPGACVSVSYKPSCSASSFAVSPALSSLPSPLPPHLLLLSAAGLPAAATTSRVQSPTRSDGSSLAKDMTNHEVTELAEGHNMIRWPTDRLPTYTDGASVANSRKSDKMSAKTEPSVCSGDKPQADTRLPSSATCKASPSFTPPSFIARSTQFDLVSSTPMLPSVSWTGTLMPPFPAASLTGPPAPPMRTASRTVPPGLSVPAGPSSRAFDVSSDSSVIPSCALRHQSSGLTHGPDIKREPQVKASTGQDLARFAQRTSDPLSLLTNGKNRYPSPPAPSRVNIACAEGARNCGGREGKDGECPAETEGSQDPMMIWLQEQTRQQQLILDILKERQQRQLQRWNGPKRETAHKATPREDRQMSANMAEILEEKADGERACSQTQSRLHPKRDKHGRRSDVEDFEKTRRTETQRKAYSILP